MKYVIFSICVLALLVDVNAKTCEKDSDCDTANECCKDFGIVKTCSGLRAEGDTCSGKFLCECQHGYTCKKREESFWNPIKIGSGICIITEVQGIVHELGLKNIFKD
uniref:Prokineticin domain-containing protein n=1 Tax=Strigamia maritima TaxID=126957 RepID=T1J574_STRMM